MKVLIVFSPGFTLSCVDSDSKQGIHDNGVTFTRITLLLLCDSDTWIIKLIKGTTESSSGICVC